MNRMWNEQGAPHGERSDTGAGDRDGLGSDLSASRTTPIKPKVVEPPSDRQFSILNSPVPSHLLELSREPASGPRHCNRSYEDYSTFDGSTCNVVSEPAAQNNNLPPRDEIAHNLKHLLQVISNGVCVAEARIRKGRAEELPQILQKIGEAVRKVSDGVRFMHDEAQSSRPRAVAVDIEITLQRLANSLIWAIGPSNRLAVVLASGLPTIYCVESELENAILNLVINARDAMPGGGRTIIEVVRCSGSGENDGIILRVHDSGTGMSVDVAAKAFNAYFSTKGSHGTGLGLAMVASFARSVGGSAWIEHSSAAGTTVAMHLPNS